MEIRIKLKIYIHEIGSVFYKYYYLYLLNLLLLQKISKD